MLSVCSKLMSPEICKVNYNNDHSDGDADDVYCNQRYVVSHVVMSAYLCFVL